MYGREYHNTVKQLSIILKLKKKIIWLVELNFSITLQLSIFILISWELLLNIALLLSSEYLLKFILQDKFISS